MTLRIDEAMAQEVDVARRVLGVPAVEFIRTAVALHLDELRVDPVFQERLSTMLEENAAALARARAKRFDRP